MSDEPQDGLPLASDAKGNSGVKGDAELARARPISSKTAEIILQIQQVADMLAEGKTPRQVASKLCEERGYGRTLSNRYVAATLAVLQRDGANEPIESKRARIVAMLHAQIDRAVNNKRVWEVDGEIRGYDRPDLKAANQAIALLAQIEGVAKFTLGS